MEGATILVRILLNHTLIHGNWIGPDLIETSNCFEIPISDIKFIANTGTECFQAPKVNVSISGKTLEGFLSPRTGIITKSSKKGPCEMFKNLGLHLLDHVIKVDQRTGIIKTIPHDQIEEIRLGSLSPSKPPAFHIQTFKNLVLKNMSTGQEQLLRTLRVFQVGEALRANLDHSPDMINEKGYFGGHPYGTVLPSFTFPSGREILIFLLRLWVLIYVGLKTAIAIYRFVSAVKWMMQEYLKRRGKSERAAEKEDSKSESESPEPSRKRRNRRKRAKKGKIEI